MSLTREDVRSEKKRSKFEVELADRSQTGFPNSTTNETASVIVAADKLQPGSEPGDI